MNLDVEDILNCSLVSQAWARACNDQGQSLHQLVHLRSPCLTANRIVGTEMRILTARHQAIFADMVRYHLTPSTYVCPSVQLDT